MKNWLYGFILLSLFAFAHPVHAKRLAAVTITTPVTAQITTPNQSARANPLQTLAIQARLAVGTGGTSVNCWVQTSLDGGTTWVDVAAFSFTVAATKIQNVSSTAAINASATPSDGALTADTSVNILGPLWRVKYTTVGTYTGGTQLLVDINGAQFTTSP